MITTTILGSCEWEFKCITCFSLLRTFEKIPFFGQNFRSSINFFKTEQKTNYILRILEQQLKI